MAIQGYGSAPPRIGKIAPGRGIIARQIGAQPQKPSINRVRMVTAKGRLGRR